MKKRLLIVFIMMLILHSAAQQQFKVPQLPDSVRYSVAVFQLNGMILNTIYFGKSMGKTVEETTAFTADHFKTSWPKENGYTVFVQVMMRNWVSVFPKGKVEILEQTENTVRIKVSDPFPELKQQGTMLDVTYDEFTRFWEGILKGVGEYLGNEILFEALDNGFILTVQKKSN